MKNIYDFFLPIYQQCGMNAICDGLYLHKGTVNRWMEKKEVPPQYYFDLCRIAGIDVDYSQFSDKEKDQFFTSPETATYCYSKTLAILESKGIDVSQYHFIEPSAGDGSFYNVLPVNRRTGVDIEARLSGVIQADYLTWKPTTQKNIVIGNPPFGLRGHLALKFINHSQQFADFVCFVVPQLFDSDGKGSCKSRVKGYSLIHSEVIDSNFHYPDGKEVKVNTVFQIWSKLHRSTSERLDLTKILKLYSLSDGGTPGSTRNKKHLYACNYYLPSTCFGSESMKLYSDFEDLPHRRGYGIVVIGDKDIISKAIESIDWSAVSFMSTNGAYNLRFDIIERNIYSALPDTITQPAQNPLQRFLCHA
jgi:hypothetical protein